MKRALVDPQRHVRLWISYDGLPEKQRARLIRLRAMNPLSTITLFVERRHIVAPSLAQLERFADAVTMDLVDVSAIPVFGESERVIKSHVLKEIELFFAHRGGDASLQGNLSVVADQVRLLSWVACHGMFADLDVEFRDPFPTRPIAAPYGVLARYKDDGRIVSNDFTACGPWHPSLVFARDRAAAMDCLYANVADPRHFFALRYGTLATFSYCGGPHLFAIAMNMAGVTTGHDGTTVPSVVLQGAQNDSLVYSSHSFDCAHIGRAQVDAERLLGAIFSSWDHSWVPGRTAWRTLMFRESTRLALYDAIGLSDPKRLLAMESFLSEIPRGLPFTASVWSGGFLRVSPPHGRVLPHENMPRAVRRYIARNETPSEAFRREMVAWLGDGFRKCAQRLDADGLLVLPRFLDPGDVRALQRAFEREVSKKHPNTTHHLVSFNISADAGVDEELVMRSVRASQHPTLVNLMRHHFGREIKVVALRGYRQYPTETLLYRAWDYHQDLKSKGPYGEVKVMILLTDLARDGQAMRYVDGSHRHHWHADTMRYTKYGLSESLAYGSGLSLCAGPMGSVVVFDTNGIHSGHRNMSATRDVVTVSFTGVGPDVVEMFEAADHSALMTSDPLPDTVGGDTCSGGLFATPGVDTSTATTASELRQIECEYNDATDRWEGRRKECRPRDAAVTWDVNSDLDLRIRAMVAADKDRDNVLVALRDADGRHEQYRRMWERWERPVEFPTLDQLRDTAARAVHLTRRHSATRQLSKFIRDLQEALTRLDSTQRLRSTTVFLYLAVDSAAVRLVSPELEYMSRCVLRWYAAIVGADEG